MNFVLPSRRKGLRDLQRVELLGQYTTAEGTLSSGSRGTIVYRHRHGEAFDVEFTSPVATILTLKPDEISAVDD